MFWGAIGGMPTIWPSLARSHVPPRGRERLRDRDRDRRTGRETEIESMMRVVKVRHARLGCKVPLRKVFSLFRSARVARARLGRLMKVVPLNPLRDRDRDRV